ncbi:hypothetical protein [Companilactobacillus mishanensis]|uniref:hypothetical protein n=1 Tax=Companilactobacillus mishanensis TaxID=2486008 RepID=UPI001562A9A7|nr:hypothetical protein [Companilactobacillus mishanensis]
MPPRVTLASAAVLPFIGISFEGIGESVAVEGADAAVTGDVVVVLELVTAVAGSLVVVTLGVAVVLVGVTAVAVCVVVGLVTAVVVEVVGDAPVVAVVVVGSVVAAEALPGGPSTLKTKTSINADIIDTREMIIFFLIIYSPLQ